MIPILAFLTYDGIILRNLYCPAVSQNCNLYARLSLLTICAKKSMPIVAYNKIV